MTSIFHPTTAEYTLLSSSHGTFTKLDHVLGDKIHHKKCKRTEIIQCLLSDQNEISVETNNGKINGKSLNKWSLNNTLLNNTGVKEETSK